MPRHVLRPSLFLACLLVTSCDEHQTQTTAPKEQASRGGPSESTGQTQQEGDKVVLHEIDNGAGSAFEMFYVLASGPLAGARHGPSYEFWGEGSVTVGQYRYGAEEGTSRDYRPDGSVRLVIEYKNGYEVGTKCLQGWDEIRKKEHQGDGPWTCHFANTQVVACRGQYDKGEMVGIWTYWNPHGKIWHQARCEKTSGLPEGEKKSGLVEQRTAPPWWGDVTDQAAGVDLAATVIVPSAGGPQKELAAVVEPVRPPVPSKEVELKGVPCWLPLGGEVYHTGTVPEAEREILSFGDQPRWFCSVGDKHPPPKALAQLPLTERGARLRFEAQKADEPSVLVFRLTLTATDRLLVREVEHRWTNTLPFLFALYAEGRAIRPSQEDSGFSKFGGMANLTLLVPKGEQKTWSVRVDGESLLKALPQRGPQTVSLVAAFGERQHSPMGLMGGDRFGMADALAAEFDGVTTEPPIVIRSSPVHLRWSGKDWFVTGEPGRASGGPLQAEPEAGKAKAPHAR